MFNANPHAGRKTANKPEKRNRGYPAALPETGYLRLRQILGDPTTEPPTPAIIPIGKSSWWMGIRAGKYPKGEKLGPRTTAWRVEDIRLLIEKSGNGQQVAS
jgi:prophage regulatory protein